jgi:hypothetical protein
VSLHHCGYMMQNSWSSTPLQLGRLLVGAIVGTRVGAVEGACVGAESEGRSVGASDGTAVGDGSHRGLKHDAGQNSKTITLPQPKSGFPMNPDGLSLQRGWSSPPRPLLISAWHTRLVGAAVGADVG